MEEFDLLRIPRGLAFLIALASSGIVIFFLEYGFLILLIPIIHWAGYFVSLYAPKWLGKGFLYLFFCLGIILGLEINLLVGTTTICNSILGSILFISLIFYFFIILTSILFFVFLRKKKA